MVKPLLCWFLINSLQLSNGMLNERHKENTHHIHEQNALKKLRVTATRRAPKHTKDE